VKQRKKADYQTDVVRLRIDATNQEFSDWLRPSTGSPPVGARDPVFYAPEWVVYAGVGKTPTADLKGEVVGSAEPTSGLQRCLGSRPPVVQLAQVQHA